MKPIFLYLWKLSKRLCFWESFLKQRLKMSSQLWLGLASYTSPPILLLAAIWTSSQYCENLYHFFQDGSFFQEFTVFTEFALFYMLKRICQRGQKEWKKEIRIQRICSYSLSHLALFFCSSAMLRSLRHMWRFHSTEVDVGRIDNDRS